MRLLFSLCLVATICLPAAAQPRADPDLGILRLRERKIEVTNPNQKTGALLLRTSYYQSTNLYSAIDPVTGGLVSTSLSFWVAPKLGPNTSLIAIVDGSLAKYLSEPLYDYSQVTFRLGARHLLTRQMYGEIGLNNQHFFRDGDRFLNDRSLRVAVGRRDLLTKRLRLDTLYEFRLSNANPETRSRIINSLQTSLSYALKQNLQVAVDYQFVAVSFIGRDRNDQYQRVLGRLTWVASHSSQISIQGGVSLGSSSDSGIDFDNFFLSVTYTLELADF